MVNFHMACIYRHIVLVVFLYATAIYSQECDPGFLWVEDVPSCCGAPAQHCFYETDLNILQEMIDNSLETINLEMDDNEDGEIEPVELGLTEWVDGRLVALDCFLSDIMNCNLAGPLPANFGELEYLEALWLSGNQFSGQIPESIGNLSNLELLYLSDNVFTGPIPESICNLNIDWNGANNWGVEYFNIHNNLICPPFPSCIDADTIGDQYCMEAFADLNQDSTTNVLDIIILVNIILGVTDTMPNADINGDGYINILDIVMIADFITG